MTDLTGRSLGKFKIVASVDRGAMGEVFKGYHANLDRDVAIKVLHPQLASAADFVERFEREASMVARLRHTNILQVYDFDVVDGLYFMVMEFIDGPTLKTEMSERKQRGQPFTPLEVAYIVSSLAAAMDYAHVRGIIHRDIKPSNIMFNAEGQLVLTDFGIVHIVSEDTTHDAEMLIGTPAYLSPEQAGGKPVGPPSDIYSLGIVLYELVTSRLPFSAESPFALIVKHLNEPVPPPRQINENVTAALEAALLKALDKDPLQRYQKAAQFANDVRLALGMPAEHLFASTGYAAVPALATSTMTSTGSLLEGGSDVTMITSGVAGRAGNTGTTQPYRGLFAFREADAPFFFGREEFTEQLLELAGKQPLVAIVGPSGSGKSSVVFAGLVPALRRQGNWLIEHFRPGSDPFQSLAATLVDLGRPHATPEERQRTIRRLAKALRSGERRLHEIIQGVVSRRPQGKRLLLVADQFEELFTLCDDVQTRERFMEELAEAVDIQNFLDTKTFTLIVTLRADFLGQALSHLSLAKTLQGADVKLGPMSQQDLMRAIANPARRLGVNFEPGLVVRIAGDVSDEPGNLPLLEFALAGLWSQRSSAVMMHEAYEQIGGVAGALVRHANEVYVKLTPREQQLARLALVQMVQPGEGTEDTRRVASREELSAEQWQIVQKLANERLVVTGIDQAGKETAEVVHEALIRSWDRLREWMDDDRAYRAWQERLRAAINQWEASRRDEGALLRGAPLQQTLEWAATEPVSLSTLEMTFIRLSQEAAERTEREREEQRQRELQQAQALSEVRQRQIRVVRAASLGLALLLLVALAAAVVAFWQRGVAQENAAVAEVEATSAFEARETAVANEHIAATRAVQAEHERAAAEEARAQAETRRLEADAARTEAEDERAEALRVGRLALAQSLVSLALTNVEQNNDRELAALLALEGARLNQENAGTIDWHVDRVLRPLVTQPFFNTTFSGHTGGVNDVSFAPDGSWLASGANDGTVRLWPMTEPGAEAPVLAGHEAPVLAVAFSADGTTLASGAEDGSILLWTMADLSQPPQSLSGPQGAVLALATNGASQLAAASQDGTVRVWDFNDPAPNGTILLEGERPVLGLAFSPDGQSLALARDDGTVSLLSVAGGAPARLGQHDSSVIEVAFSQDQNRLASTSVDNSVRVWNLDNPDSAPLVFNGHTSRVRGVVFLLDGQQLVSGADDATLRVWNLEDASAEPLVLSGHESRVRALALSPDGRFVASASDDQTIRLWQTAAPDGADTTLTGHDANVIAVAFSSDGRIMFSSGADNNVRLWNTADFSQLQTLSGHTGRVRVLALAPERGLLASGSDDSTIRLWNVNDLQAEPLVLEDHEGSVRALNFVEGEQALYSAGDDGVIRIWDMDNPASGPQRMATVGVAVFSLAFARGSQQLVAGTADGEILIWRLDDPGAQPLAVEAHRDRVNDLAFSPDGQLLASGSEDWTVRLWNWPDLEAGNTLLSGHKGGVRGLAFSPDGSQLVSTGQEGSVMVWNPAEPAQPPAILNGHTAAVLDMAFSPDRSFFATVSDDHTVRIWYALDRLLPLGCQLVRRNLTQAEWRTLLVGEGYRPTCPNLVAGE